MRANAADGRYGFIAEIVTLPAAPETNGIRQISIRDSRFEFNERGAIEYSSTGEENPNIYINRCLFANNGFQILDNFTTAAAAARFSLHNTQNFHYDSNMMWRNQGGLHVSAGSTNAISRLEGIIRFSAFSENQVFESVKLQGFGFQKLHLVYNYFGKNYAPYYDIVYVDQMLINASFNTFYNNTGTHVLDLTGYPRVQTEFQLFTNNFLVDNQALGHGYQFGSLYGYFPESVQKSVQKSAGGRQKRQTPTGQTSFEWWAVVGSDTERYRSTILAGSGQQKFERNYFHNPLNDFELTTVNKTK